MSYILPNDFKKLGFVCQMCGLMPVISNLEFGVWFVLFTVLLLLQTNLLYIKLIGWMTNPEVIMCLSLSNKEYDLL